MIAGLTNLDTLKKALLAETLVNETRFDLMIQTIGLGVAGIFNAFTNRRLAWMLGDTITFSGDRPHYYLPRYPILNVMSVQMKYFRTDNWNDISDQPITVNYETGLIHFGYTLGRFPLQVKAIWDGGYWFEPLEPDDDAYPSTAPVGAVLLPDDLKAAFLLQCEEVWAQRDKLGSGIIDKPGAQSGLSKLELAPLVKMVLQTHIRYQLS